jgi:hypothetical protein
LKATRFIFAEFNISSIPIKTAIAFFFATAPYRPIQNRAALNNR